MRQGGKRGKRAGRLRQLFQHKRLGAGLALTLTLAVGFGVPLGDASSSYALTAPDEHSPADDAVSLVPADEALETPQGSSEGDAADLQNDPGEGERTPLGDAPLEETPTDAPDSDSVDGEDAPSVPNETDEKLKLSPMLQSAEEELSVGTFAMPTTEPHLIWEVTHNGNLVGGATVQMSGPRSGTSWNNTSNILDCTSAPGPCAEDSFDQDPTPGKFAVAKRLIGTATSTQPIAHGEVFRIRPLSTGAPSGMQWMTAPTNNNWMEIPRNGNTATSAAWPSGTPGYTFDSSRLRLVESPSLTWSVKQETAPVKDGIVTLEGPRISNSNWTRAVQVADCTTYPDPCPSVLMDQDPRAGEFKVHTMRWATATGFATQAIDRTKRYQITPYDSPVGYQWDGTDSLVVGGTGNNASGWPANTAYHLGTFQVTQSAKLIWDVSDQNGPVGGATVQLQGAYSNGNWGQSYYVTDCSQGPCHPESMDQNPAPGKFEVDTLRGLNGALQTVVQVEEGRRYRITPVGSIPEYQWDSSGWQLIPQAANNANNGVNWTADLEYTFNDLKVAGGRPFSDFCSAPAVPNAYYSLNRPSGNSANIQRLQYNEDETSILAGATKIGGQGTGTSAGQVTFSDTNTSANALGVTPTGIFYFTAQDGRLGEDYVANRRNATVYRFDPSADAAPYPVFNMDLLSPTTGTIVSGDATIYNEREEFYFAYYSESQVEGKLRFHLYRYSHGDGQRTGEVQHVDVVKPAGFSAGMNGDFSFDGQNNIQFLISNGDTPGITVSGLVNASDFQPNPSAHALPDVTLIQGTVQEGPTAVPYGRINGVTYTKGGRAIVQQSTYTEEGWFFPPTRYNQNSLIQLPSLTGQTAKREFNTTGIGSLVDLASCDTPTTISVKKNVIGERFEDSDQFRLDAKRTLGTSVDTFTSATTTGTSAGLQQEQIGPFVTTLAGTFSATETFTDGTDPDKYTTSWECHVLDASGEAGASFASSSDSGAQPRNISFNLSGENVPAGVVPGADLECIFTNEALRDKLVVSKTSDPMTGTAVDEEDLVKFTLTFDNTDGTLPADVDHIDHLFDVLDDADFVNETGDVVAEPYFTFGGGTPDLTATWASTNEQIAISGEVPAGQSRTVSFSVKVKLNAADASERQKTDANSAQAGYLLRNYLTPATVTTPPEVCEHVDGEPPTCTEHPVKAWTVTKESLPASGARLHAGGNAHYKVTAKKLSSSTVIDDLVFTDDLTNVFNSAGFAPEAAVPGGALKRGIYFFDAEGFTLNSVTQSDTNSGRNTDVQTAPVAAYEGEAAVPDPEGSVGGTWTITSERVHVPKNAVRAELWFAVQAGEPMAIPGTWPTNQFTGNPAAPTMGAKFTNYVTASANTAPAQCATGSANTSDPNFPAECQVTHELQENYFTVRKDAQGPSVDAVNLDANGNVSDSAYGSDTTGMWNMVGHQFEIRNNIDGAPSAGPAVELCRTTYNPGPPETPLAERAWNGVFTDSGTPDWSENSETLAAIIAWNNAHPELAEADKLPLCATFYAQGKLETYTQAELEVLNAAVGGPSGQTGRWRSENLGTGEYWLVETKAPSHQISTGGTQIRPVPGIQLLAEPVPFKIWPDAAEESPTHPQSQHGKGQLDVSTGSSFSEWLARCQPGVDQPIGQRPVACVNPTGYLMLVKDPSARSLPLSGGQLLGILTTGGLVVLVGAIAGVMWWRRREANRISAEELTQTTP